MRVEIMDWEELDRLAGIEAAGSPGRVQAPTRKPPRLANVTPTVWLSDPIRLPLMGRTFTAEVDYTTGLHAYEIHTRAVRLAQQEEPDLEEYKSILDQAVALCGPLLIPQRIRWRDRVRMWLGRWNPLRRGTERDIVEVLAFFLMLRATRTEGG